MTPFEDRLRRGVQRQRQQPTQQVSGSAVVILPPDVADCVADLVAAARSILYDFEHGHDPADTETALALSDALAALDEASGRG